MNLSDTCTWKHRDRDMIPSLPFIPQPDSPDIPLFSRSTTPPPTGLGLISPMRDDERDDEWLHMFAVALRHGPRLDRFTAARSS